MVLHIWLVIVNFVGKDIFMSNEDKIKIGGRDEGVLKRFMQEFFPYQVFKKSGFFTKEMKGDYYLQAKRVCDYFGFESIFEYGSEEIRCHISYIGERPENDKEFITVIPSIYA